MDLKTKGHSDAANQYAPYVVVNSNRWYWNGDASAGRRALSIMSEWANADALRGSISDYGNNGRTSSDRWPSYGVLTATLNSLFLLQNHPDLTEARSQAIWSWIDRTMARGWLFGQLPRGGAGALNDTEQRKNNHNARRALFLLYYAIHKDDERLIRKSLSDINRSYKSFDGAGVPLDANRGDWALNYVNFALDSMTLHASLMETVSPGYLQENPGVVSKLNAGIAFLFTELVSPNRVHGYANDNVGRPQSRYTGRQDTWFARDIHFAQSFGHGSIAQQPNGCLTGIPQRDALWAIDPSGVRRSSMKLAGV